MLLDSAKHFGIAAAVLALLAFGCTEGSDDDTDDDGTANAAGTDSVDNGGASGGGDSDGSGGTAGAPSGGGASGAGTEQPAEEEPLYTFAEDDEGFDFEAYYNETEPYVNLADIDPADEAQPAEGLEYSWSDVEGFDGEPGVIEVAAPFSDWNQSFDLQLEFDPLDYSGRTLRARVKIVDGFVNTEGAAGGGTLFVKAGDDWVYARGAWTTLTADQYTSWVEFEFDLDNPDDANDGYDPALIRAIGVQVSTGQAPASGDPPAPATIQIDHITIE